MNDKIKLIDEKLSELKADIAAMKTNETVAKSTRGTQLYKMGRDRKILCLIRSLLEANPSIKLSSNDNDTLVSITTLKTERTFSPIIVAEGEMFLDVLQRYSDKKTNSIMKAVEKAGLHVDYTTGKLAK